MKLLHRLLCLLRRRHVYKRRKGADFSLCACGASRAVKRRVDRSSQ